MDDRSVLIAAGGTGGHLAPGLALGEELSRRGISARYIVREKDVGIPLLERKGSSYAVIRIRGWDRSVSLRTLSLPVVLAAAIIKMVRLIRKYRPSVVVGMGGYTALPAVIAARLKGIPVVIHEQNAVPGLTNRISSRFAETVAVSFEGTAKYFKSGKVVCTGNPVRGDLGIWDAVSARKRLGLERKAFVVMVFGGSQGAAGLNRCVIEALDHIGGSGTESPVFIHLTGKCDHAMVRDSYSKKGFKAIVEEFSFDMGTMYAAADLVISRSGASTVTELMHTRKPAILIPFPHATADHQTANAMELFTRGCAVIMSEKDRSGERLGQAITKYRKDRQLLRTMAERYEPIAGIPSEAAARLADEVRDLIPT